MERKIIMAVCKGNIHRSVVAEACINKLLKERGFGGRYVAISRGIRGTAGMRTLAERNLQDYPQDWERNKPSLETIGIDISAHACTPISHNDVECAAVILVMDRKVFDAPEYGPACLVMQFPSHQHKMHLFLELEGTAEGIEDCGAGAAEEQYRHVNERIHQVLQEHLDVLMRWASE